jgi:hypothetical protein
LTDTGIVFQDATGLQGKRELKQKLIIPGFPPEFIPAQAGAKMTI